MRSRILIVARNGALRAGLARLPRGVGHSIELAENAAHARRLGADLKSVDLVLVALDGLGHEGNTLAAELQATSKPLLLLSSATSSNLPELKRVVVDPADEATLLARVAEALRRRRAEPEAAEAAPVLCFAGYRLDLAGHGLARRTAGRSRPSCR